MGRPEWIQHFSFPTPLPLPPPRTRIPRRPKVVRAVFTKAGPWVTLPMKVLIFELSTRQAKLPQIKAGTSTTSPAIACAVVKASNWISFWIRAPTDTTTTTGMRVLLAVWRDASCVQRECGMRQCQGRGPYVRATLGALSQVAPGRLRQGTHMDPGCRRMLMGQHGLGTGDPRITRFGSATLSRHSRYQHITHVVTGPVRRKGVAHRGMFPRRVRTCAVGVGPG